MTAQKITKLQSKYFLIFDYQLMEYLNYFDEMIVLDHILKLSMGPLYNDKANPKLPKHKVRGI